MASVVDNEVLRPLNAFAERYRCGQLGAAELAATAFLYWQIAAHGAACASRKSKADPKPDYRHWLKTINSVNAESRREFLFELIQRYQFHEVSPRATRALAAWLNDEWALCLYETIPAARDVLSLQCQAKRPVTILCDYPRLLSPVLDKPNAFVFMLHDLEHAYQFYHDADMHRVQVQFARWLQRALLDGLFDGLLQEALFSEQFDYLISDMNTHPLHGLHYLHAIIVDCHLRAEGKHRHDRLSMAAHEAIRGHLLALTRCWRLNRAAAAAMLRISAGHLSTEHAAVLLAALASESNDSNDSKAAGASTRARRGAEEETQCVGL